MKRRCVNIETSERRLCVSVKRSCTVLRLTTGPIKLYRPFLRATSEKEISMKELDKSAFPQDIQRYSLKSYRRQFEISLCIRDLKRFLVTGELLELLLVREHEFNFEIYHTNKLLSR